MIKLAWWTQVAQWDGVVREDELKTLRGVRIVHLMPTFKQCKDIYKNDTLEALNGDWSFLRPKIDQTIWKISFPGGSWIQWFGAREANSARGVRADIVTVDEADDIDPAILDSVVKPWFTEPWSMRIVLLGGTPRRGRYGLLYREYESGRRGAEVRAGRLETKPQLAEFLRRKHSFHATYRDAANVDRQFIEEQRAAHEDSGKLPVFKREYECDFDSAEGLVYSMFEPTFHVREPPQGVQWSEVLVGADFGYEDPGVLLVIAVVGNGADAVLYVVGEVYQRQKTPGWWKEQAKEIVRRWPNAKWYCDTARPDMIAEYRSVGAKVQQFDKGEIEGGVMAVADRLAVRHVGDELNSRYSRIYVSPRCRNTIEELGKYRRKRDPKNADRFLDDIEDANNHCLVAGTMVATAAGDVPIERVAAGDMVLTRDGYREVAAAGMTMESAPIWRLETSGGRVLEGTGNHQIWTSNRGWVRLDGLRYGDILVTCQDRFTTTQTESSSTAYPSAATPTRRGSNSADTTSPSAATACIRPSGSSTTARSLQGTTSTTRTGTPSTTTSPTWSVPRPANMRESMAPKREPSGSGSTSRESVRSQQSGTEARRVALGTWTTPSVCSATWSLLPGSASDAEPTTRPKSRPAPVSAPTHARQPTAEQLEPMTLTGCAPFAAPPSGSTGTTRSSLAPESVEHVSPAGRSEAVYDLTVRDVHEFYANGVLVHNCMDSIRYATVGRFGGVQRKVIESGPGWGS